VANEKQLEYCLVLDCNHINDVKRSRDVCNQEITPGGHWNEASPLIAAKAAGRDWKRTAEAFALTGISQRGHS